MQKILDFGVGRYPYFTRYNLKTIRKDDEYWGVDQCAHCLELAKKRSEEFFKQNPDTSFKTVFAVVEPFKLHFASEYFDKIILSNVLSAPIHETWNKEGTHQKLNFHVHTQEPPLRPLANIPGESDKFYQERKVLLTEILRVLKPGGILKIYTDLIIYGIASYERILLELKADKGFEFKEDAEEEKHIDELNRQKLLSGKSGNDFLAEVLPRSNVYEFKKTTSF